MSKHPHSLPLAARHEQLGARFAEFAGYRMPMRYGSVVEEHHAVRRNLGLFDVSHMGEILLRGPRALEVVDRLLTNDVSQLSDNQALYSVMCHPNGGIVDDLIAYRLAHDRYLLCVNAANRAKDLEHVRGLAQGACDVADLSDEVVQLALQGPRAVELLATLVDFAPAELPGFQCRYAPIAGARTLIARTGYTGEDGFELYIPLESAENVFDAIWEAGEAFDLKMIGLIARDTLRLEAKLLLYGNDITDETTPLEAGLGWVVKLDKGDFIGRDALLKQKRAGLKRRLRGLILESRGVLRPMMEVFVGDERVGMTTSGGPAPSLDTSIALAYLDVPHAAADRVDVDVRGKRLPCRVTAKRFYERG